MSTIKVNNLESATGGGTAAKIASINDGALSNRNLLHNSSYEIWQRGTAFSSAATGGNRYTADRWSVPRRTRVARSTDVPAGFKYAILLDREQTGGTEPFTLSQGIEERDIQFTGNYTLSFYAKSSDISTVNINVQDRTTVSEGGTNHSSIVTNQSVSITSSWARYTHTFSLSSTSLTGTCLRISIGNTSASQHDELLLTGIQLETGSVATNIEKRSFGHELSLCYRYFYKNLQSPVGLFIADAADAGKAYGFVRFPVTMRTAPTVVLADNNGNTDGKVTQHGAAHNLAATASQIQKDGFCRVIRSSGTFNTLSARPIVAAVTSAEAEL